ncbi:MAG: helix-turn-helix transcriptional regulator [Clostridia bacterium]|nr:helix-turn-helix transcriptional regulator [Clostridia bacterium]
MFFTYEGDLFSVTAEDGMEYCYISFHGRRADELILRFGLDLGDPIYRDRESLIPFWNDCQEKANDGNIDILCESVLLYSLANLPPLQKESDDTVSKVIALLQKQFSHPDLSITRIADELGYTPKYLSSLFKKKKGISFTAYLREPRIRHALFLMEQGVVSVKNVAILSGFRDALYFSKIFTAEVGIPPKVYIQQQLRENGRE